MLDKPTFNLPLGAEVSGDDPLGLAPVNERLYGSVLPGINNVVRFIRVYGILCWAAWQVEEYLAARGDKMSSEEVFEFSSSIFEKVELVLTWCHLDQDAREPGDLVGANRKFPVDEKRIKLRFESFGTNEAAYLSAVQYRPSVTNGLGFLEGREHDTFGCTSVGMELAHALDASLMKCPDYDWLKNPRAFATTRSQVLGFFPYLNLRKPTRQEQAIFLSRLIPETEEAEDDSFDANRRAGMVLVLRAVAATNSVYQRRHRNEIGATEDEVRAAMARGCSFDGRTLNLHHVEKAQAKWATLQLRQYQRACYEAFYVAIEVLLSGLYEVSDRSVRGLATRIGELASEGLVKKQKGTVAGLVQEIRKLQGDSSSLYMAGLKESTANVFQLRKDLLALDPKEIEEGVMPLVSQATWGLVFCAVEADNLRKDKRFVPYLRLDDDKKPLFVMPELIDRFSKSLTKDFVAHIVQQDVVARHFEVVSSRARSGDEKNRFRFVQSDDGLRRYDEERNLPGLGEAQDRLARALQLLEQCQLLKKDGSGYVVTSRAEQYL